MTQSELESRASIQTEKRELLKSRNEFMRALKLQQQHQQQPQGDDIASVLAPPKRRNNTAKETGETPSTQKLDELRKLTNEKTNLLNEIELNARTLSAITALSAANTSSRE